MRNKKKKTKIGKKMRTSNASQSLALVIREETVLSLCLGQGLAVSRLLMFSLSDVFCTIS